MLKINAAIRLLAILSIVAGSPITAALADDDLAANPFRPSVGSPASLSAPGHFEMEAGFANETAAGARLNNTPMLLKYAFTDRIGVTFGISPWMRVSALGTSVSGNSDGSVTLKLAQPVSDAFMIGGELTASVPVASNGLGSDRSDVTLNLIASNDFAGFHSDINVNTTRLGDAQSPGVSGQSYGWSAGISHPVNEKLGAGFELSGTRQRGIGTSNQWLAFLSFAVSKKLVLDLYAAREHAAGVDTNKFGFGFTYLFAR
jgi:hypothetical protein